MNECTECYALNLGRKKQERRLYCPACQPATDHFERYSASTGEIAERIFAEGKKKAEGK